jgi:hypothetical protein
LKTQEKSNRSDIETDQEREGELPELAVRIVSDFARIVGAEARLLESNIVVAAQTLLDRIYIASTLIVLAGAGIVALLASLALLLHQWMHWWQVLGLVGGCAIIAAELLWRSLTAATASQASLAVTQSQR